MYTDLMRRAVSSIPIPKEFKMDVVDYGPFLTLQFYESQWRHFTDKERLRCITYLERVKKALEKLGASVAIDPILDINPKDALRK
jgi:hypothetical protein